MTATMWDEEAAALLVMMSFTGPHETDGYRGFNLYMHAVATASAVSNLIKKPTKKKGKRGKEAMQLTYISPLAKPTYTATTTSESQD